jgi:hypothetical protein
MGYPKVGIVLIVLGSILLIAGLIIGLVFQLYVRIHAFDGYLDYSPDPNYNNPNYESCTNDTFNVFMFNMTNSENVLGGAAPNYQQVGPYNFTRAVCTFNVTNDNSYEYYKQYWEPYYLIPGSGVSDSDLIINFNPGYLSVIKAVEALAPSDPEGALLSQLIGPALQQIISGITSSTFVNQAKVLGVAQVLAGIQAQVIPQVVLSVKAAAALGFVAQAIGPNITSIDFFFNAPAAPFGIANITNSSPAFTITSENIVLFGNVSNGEPAGWLTDTTGVSFLTFLQTAGTAALTYQATGNATVLAPFLLSYQISPGQLFYLLEYGNYLITTAYKFVYSDAIVTQIANGLFYSQFANGTGIAPNGLPLPPSGVKGLEVYGPSNPSNISLASSIELWDVNNPSSFTNLNGIARWFNAALLFNNTANFTLLAGLATTFQLNYQQVVIVSQWLALWQNTLVTPFILAQYNLTSLTDVAWLQYGTGGVLPNGLSVADFEPALAAAPEFSIFALRNNLTLRLSVSRAKSLLNGPTGFAGVNGSAPLFLTLLSTGQFTTIQSLFQLSQSEALQWYKYLQYIQLYFVEPLFTAIFAQGGGPITTRTPRQILFEAVDPLISFLEGPAVAKVGVFYLASQDYPTRASAAANSPLLNKTIFFGTDRTQLNNFLQISTYQGLSYVPGYHNAPVTGNKDGLNFVPQSLDTNTELIIWNELIEQPIPFKFDTYTNLKGIDLWQYRVADEFWESESQNPARIPYDQVYYGLVNLTGIKPLRTFLSRPHFLKVDPIVASSVTGLNPNNPYYDDDYLGVNYLSGISMVNALKYQVSVGYPNLKHFYNISAGYAPIAWRDQYTVISDSDANTFKNALTLLQAAVIIPFVVGIILGLILIVIGVVLLVLSKRENNYVDEPTSTKEETKKAASSVPMETLEINDEGVETRASNSSSE